jgi:hypothetical protein
LNVLRLTEPRSAVAEIDLGNTLLGDGGSLDGGGLHQLAFSLTRQAT